MNLERERRAASLFTELCELPAEERRIRLARIAEEDPELARAVEELFELDAAPAGFLESPALGGSFRLSGPYAAAGQLEGADADDAARHPQAIGPYRIVEPLGEGGMGVVYRARQPRTQRDVALKVVRAGLFDARAHRYFEMEAEALGRLTHPGIALIHEAGTADFGRGPVPFLVMELVEGPDLATYARESGLSNRKKVELLVQVCEAVHHAHQNRVVHRDLKPANILVPPGGRPRVIDFGLAHLSDEGAKTAEGEDARRILGTLAYMAPERVDPDLGDVDSRAVDASTDVYSLGATAYELLSGRPPFAFEGQTLPQALHTVAHEEPEPLGAPAWGVDRDLAATVAKAMARRKGDRYHSAAAFAEDLGRWLGHQPVQARRGGRVEQLQLFTRRNRLLVGAAVSVVLALLAGVIGTAWQGAAARRQAALSERISVYLQGTLRSASDPRTDGKVLPISHVLASAAADLEEAFPDHPLIRAELANTLGMSYFENGMFAEAEELVRHGLDLRTSELPADAPEVLASRHDLGVVLVALGLHAAAEKHLRAAYEGRAEVLGAEHEGTQRSASWLGQVVLQKADPSEAEALFEEVLAIRRRTLGDDAPATLATRERLAQVWRLQGRLADAEAALRAVLETQVRICGPDHFDVHETRNNLASVLVDLGRFEEVEELLEKALAGYEQLRGADHPDTELVRMNLSVIRGVPSRTSPDEAAGVPAEELKSPRYYALLIPAANQKFYAGELQEAERELRTAAEGLERLGGQDRYLAPARQSRASVLVELGRLEEAMGIQREVLAAHVAAGTDRSTSALSARTALAESLRRAGSLDEALIEARRAYRTLRDDAGETALFTLAARAILAGVLADRGQLEEAAGNAEAAARLAAENLGPGNQYTAIIRVRAGRVLALAGRSEDAARELLAAHAVLAKLHGERGPYTLHAARALAGLYADQGREEEARRWSGPGPDAQGTPIEAAAGKR